MNFDVVSTVRLLINSILHHISALKLPQRHSFVATVVHASLRAGLIPAIKQEVVLTMHNLLLIIALEACLILLLISATKHVIVFLLLEIDLTLVERDVGITAVLEDWLVLHALSVGLVLYDMYMLVLTLVLLLVLLDTFHAYQLLLRGDA